MKIAVIGAGPAGLVSAKQALQHGHDVTVFEKHAQIGGIWNPRSGGAYQSVRMQSSRMSFHYSDFTPTDISDFPTLLEVHNYLTEYAKAFGIFRHIRPGCTVVGVEKRDRTWRISISNGSDAQFERADKVIVANGELWLPRLHGARLSAGSGTSPRVLSAKQYRGPAEFHGQRILVVGGGVSGADIASELVGATGSVDWSVRRQGLFLPRDCGGFYNDQLFSYIGRYGAHELAHGRYMGFLRELLPEYMRQYKESGLLPLNTPNNAVHVNEKIIPAVAAGRITVRPAFRDIGSDGAVHFSNGSTAAYDVVILCTGYEMPDYGFIKEFAREDLYEHFFYWKDPSLAIVNTPVDADAFGTACPYFEAISGWVLRVFEGAVRLPEANRMEAWCRQNMRNLEKKRFYDCWLETIRIAILSGQIPNPNQDFEKYWTIISSIVSPSNLCTGNISARPAACDDIVDVPRLKARLLSSLPNRTRKQLLRAGQISALEWSAAANVPRVRGVPPAMTSLVAPSSGSSEPASIQSLVPPSAEASPAPVTPRQ